MLAARRARRHGEMRMTIVGAACLDFVLGGQPQVRPFVSLGKTDHGAADAADKAVHDRPQERPPFDSCGRTEGEPGQNLRLSHRPADRRSELGWQFVERTRRGQGFAQPVHQLVARERGV